MRDPLLMARFAHQPNLRLQTATASVAPFSSTEVVRRETRVVSCTSDPTRNKLVARLEIVVVIAMVHSWNTLPSFHAGLPVWSTRFCRPYWGGGAQMTGPVSSKYGLVIQPLEAGRSSSANRGPTERFRVAWKRCAMSKETLFSETANQEKHGSVVSWTPLLRRLQVGFALTITQMLESG